MYLWATVALQQRQKLKNCVIDLNRAAFFLKPLQRGLAHDPAIQIPTQPGISGAVLCGGAPDRSVGSHADPVVVWLVFVVHVQVSFCIHHSNVAWIVSEPLQHQVQLAVPHIPTGTRLVERWRLSSW